MFTGATPPGIAIPALHHISSMATGKSLNLSGVCISLSVRRDFYSSILTRVSLQGTENTPTAGTYIMMTTLLLQCLAQDLMHCIIRCVCVYACACVCMDMCAMVHMWKSENTLGCHPLLPPCWRQAFWLSTTVYTKKPGSQATRESPVSISSPTARVLGLLTCTGFMY